MWLIDDRWPACIPRYSPGLTFPWVSANFVVIFLFPLVVWLHHDGRDPVCGPNRFRHLWIPDDLLPQPGRTQTPALKWGEGGGAAFMHVCQDFLPACRKKSYRAFLFHHGKAGMPNFSGFCANSKIAARTPSIDEFVFAIVSHLYPIWPLYTLNPALWWKFYYLNQALRLVSWQSVKQTSKGSHLYYHASKY